MMVKQARARGLDPGSLSDFGLWALVGGLIGAHLMHVLLYHPRSWRGTDRCSFSSSGWALIHSGVLGGIGAAILFFRRRVFLSSAIRIQSHWDSLLAGDRAAGLLYGS